MAPISLGLVCCMLLLATRPFRLRFVIAAEAAGTLSFLAAYLTGIHHGYLVTVGEIFYVLAASLVVIALLHKQVRPA